MGAINVLVALLAIRLILFVAIVGAIVLTFTVERSPDQWRLAALAIYCAVTILPLTWLAARK